MLVNRGLHSMTIKKQLSLSSPRSRVPYQGNQTLEGPGVELRSGPEVPSAATEGWKKFFSGECWSSPTTDSRKRGQVASKVRKEGQWGQS